VHARLQYIKQQIAAQAAALSFSITNFSRFLIHIALHSLLLVSIHALMLLLTITTITFAASVWNSLPE